MLTLKFIIASVILLNFGSVADIGDFLRYGIDRDGNARNRGKTLSQSYSCPLYKTMSREIPLSPFKLSSRVHRRNGRSDKGHITTIIPVYAKTFAQLGLAVLPNMDICVAGRKLERFRFPNNRFLQFNFMLTIAIWFSQCLQKETHIKIERCFDIQMNKFSKMQFLPLYLSLNNYINEFAEHK